MAMAEDRSDKIKGTDFDSSLRVVYALIIVSCFIVIGFRVGSHFSANYLWDDAYMFSRYADNLISTGKISWNPGGEPTYGLTSPLYLIVVTPLRLLFPDNVGLAVILSSCVCGFTFLLLLPVLLHFSTKVNLVSKVVTALVFISFTSSSVSLPIHFTSGMDTTFTLAYITMYLCAAVWWERSNSRKGSLVVCLLGGITFLVRPDLLLYTIFVPFMVLILGTSKSLKIRGGLILGATLILLGIQIFFTTYYFKSPLPLPFYAKSTRLYGAFIYTLYRSTALNELLAFIISYRFPLSIMVVVGVPTLVYKRQWLLTPVETGVFVATALFLIYYSFFVLQIMYYGQRFYYPVLPAIVLLVSRYFEHAFIKTRLCLSNNLAKSIQEGSPKVFLAVSLLLLATLLLPIQVEAFWELRSVWKSHKFAAMDVAEVYKEGRSHIWIALDDFSNLPDDLVIATTEIGQVAALNPNKTVVDLAGLNETYFAHNGFSASWLFLRYGPDLIYMPHPHYKEMIKEIERSPSFSNYEYFPPESLGLINTSSGFHPYFLGIALRKDSKYYGVMLEIIQKRISN
ncbi:MAG: hypothetical protein AB1894_21750 [Chloroflexota bacterium]